MNVKPKFVYYDIRRKQSVCLTMYTHENDVDTQVLEVSMLDDGEPIELDADYTYSAAIVNRETKALINDNISCELNDSGNVLIPIDDFHTLGAQDLLIELTITDSAGDQVLVTPFPLWIHVNASILDDAQVTPESQGTVPELLEEAKEALENAGDYESLENKPQINGHELVGNKTGDELGLQGKLTAGENVTIDENGEISATGGTNDYTELNNLPLLKAYKVSVGGAEEGIHNFDIKGKFLLPSSGFRIYEEPSGLKNIRLQQISVQSLYKYQSYLVGGRIDNNEKYDFNTLGYDFQRAGMWTPTKFNCQNIPHVINVALDSEAWFFIVHLFTNYNTTGVIYRLVIAQNAVFGQYIRIPAENYSGTVTELTSWKELTSTISSAAVNQNGTITFTMSDGSTVTTTGESVIGPQGPAGADGQQGPTGADWVPTETELNDIAQRAVNLIPTTQGVLYGN